MPCAKPRAGCATAAGSSISHRAWSACAPTYAVYAATKAGVEALTACSPRRLRGRNITVNAIAPGPTATDLFLDGKSPELIDRMAKLAPLERLGEPADIAAAVAFLAGPDGAWINGQTFAPTAASCESWATRFSTPASRDARTADYLTSSRCSRLCTRRHVRDHSCLVICVPRSQMRSQSPMARSRSASSLAAAGLAGASVGGTPDLADRHLGEGQACTQ